MVSSDNMCYRRTLFFVYVCSAVFAQIPVALFSVLNSEVFEGFSDVADCPDHRHQQNYKHHYEHKIHRHIYHQQALVTGSRDSEIECTQKEYALAFLLVVSAAALLVIAVKTYFAVVIAAFQRELTDRLVHHDVVDGEVAKTPIGEVLAEGASICLEIAMGVPHDALDEEKDAAMGIVSSCRRHTERKINEGESEWQCSALGNMNKESVSLSGSYTSRGSARTQDVN